ncbi:MAG: outer membrane protein assembly factor BamD [Sedimentisphaerales bacterium]|nr:outer membrane protein assembly factor BamD [Sedimentisphaerales bacterium]
MRIKGFILVIVLWSAVIASAETWHLAGGEEWQKVDQAGGSAFMMAVAQAKQLISTGQTAKAKKAYEELQADYPQIAGDDFDAFVKAEMLYGQRDYVRAAQAYDRFTDKFPQSKFYQSALERQQQIATAFLYGQKITALKVIKIRAYEEGDTIMHKIADKAGDAPVAKSALKTLANSRAKRGDYYEAYRAWSDVSNRWPTGQTGQEALFGMARTLEQSYNGPKFDSKVLESSKSYYSEYQKRYPDVADELDVTRTLDNIEENLAEKDLTVGNFYFKTGKYTAAKMYYEKVIKTWPDSISARQAEQKMNELEGKQEIKEQDSSEKKKLDLKGWMLWK